MKSLIVVLQCSLLCAILTNCTSSQQSRNQSSNSYNQVLDSVPRKTTPKVLRNVDVPTPNSFHGIGFARYSTYDPDRAFSEARVHAITDLASNILTSVFLEYYGTNTQPTQLESEFAIADTLPTSKLVVLDSTRVDDWAVYFISSNEIELSVPQSISEVASSLDWTSDSFQPVNINGYWISAGWVPINVYNPNRGWTLAKQEALKNLSLNRSSVVQANERMLNEVYRSINYTTSKHVFNNIHSLGRKLVNGKVYVLLAVKNDNIIRIED